MLRDGMGAAAAAARPVLVCPLAGALPCFPVCTVGLSYICRSRRFLTLDGPALDIRPFWDRPPLPRARGRGGAGRGGAGRGGEGRGGEGRQRGRGEKTDVDAGGKRESAGDDRRAAQIKYKRYKKQQKKTPAKQQQHQGEGFFSIFFFSSVLYSSLLLFSLPPIRLPSASEVAVNDDDNNKQGCPPVQPRSDWDNKVTGK